MRRTTQKALVVAGLGLAALGSLHLIGSRRSADAAPEATASPEAKDPRLILGRPWFDKLPRRRTDEVDVWIFFGGGIGLEDKGSVYRSTVDFFDFERQGGKAEMVFFQDKKKESLKFSVVECHDTGSFDLCLDLDPPLRGQKRLYSWGSDEEMDTDVPWMKDWRAGAEARARGAR